MPIQKAEWYGELAQRSGNASGWLDETLEDVSNRLLTVFNEEDASRKNQILKSVMSYLNGLQDGNRFAKPSPFGPGCEKLPKGGTRIFS